MLASAKNADKIVRRANIKGQPHHLAYITEGEADMLRQAGGGVDEQGRQIYGPGGVPAFPPGASPGHGPGAGSGGGSVGGQHDGGPGATGHGGGGGGGGRDVGRTPGYNDINGLTRDHRGSFRGAGNWGRSLGPAPDLSAFGGPGPAISGAHNLGWENATMAGFDGPQRAAAMRAVNMHDMDTEDAVGMVNQGMDVDSWGARTMTRAFSTAGLKPDPAQTKPGTIAGYMGGMVPGVNKAMGVVSGLMKGNPASVMASAVGGMPAFADMTGAYSSLDGMFSDPFGGNSPSGRQARGGFSSSASDAGPDGYHDGGGDDDTYSRDVGEKSKPAAKPEPAKPAKPKAPKPTRNPALHPEFRDPAMAVYDPEMRDYLRQYRVSF